MKKLALCLCSIVVLCFFNLVALRAEEPTQETASNTQQEKPAIIEAANALFEYLKLQISMQAESRQFTLISNVMKTKDETEKNAINNTR